MTWLPTADIQALRARAELYADIRRFFAERKVLEVDTPVLSAAAVSDPHLTPMCSRFQGPGFEQGLALFLQTSPEYPMKRLLAAGSGPIYQLAKAFRDGERGRKHNPEFCMLEWYRPGMDDVQLMDEVQALVAAVLKRQDFQRISYRELFQQQLGIDPHTAPLDQLQQLVRQRLDLSFDGERRDDWLDLLIGHCLEPTLIEPTFVYDYPASQAALARVSIDGQGQPVARRFELFVNGVELANGYFELTDAQEQATRFEQDLRTRAEQQAPCYPTDQRLVQALAAGMPDCAGVALGVDRLLMLRLGATSIDQVLAFPIERA